MHGQGSMYNQSLTDLVEKLKEERETVTLINL